ncbi:cytochrome c oxidase accessory protein CcoG [Sinimarinibacterium flocculans]|uniref:cytochrome c oxidase accessory protein CcoG n=1 Tax=Sinimarinibacterium flocculans TaxID=985250 RepID=UPI0035153131
MTGTRDSLYVSRRKIQPRAARGRYARLRVLAMLVLLGLYYVLPWLSVGGEPLVLLDLPQRRFHVFGLTLMPQDLYLLTALLVVAAFTLFLFTTLAGRLWCGYACPQTVWTEAFMWMERWVEGDARARARLDRSRWNAGKLLRRGGKHLLWIAFALATGLSFVAYFVPARELFAAAFSLDLSGWPLFWSLFYGFATWGNAGFLREQVCKYMCPYARFQSAMFDKDTLIIAYDEQRGEPRKSLARKLARQQEGTSATPGDCVDCSICVQVCPVGIDIRDGLQYECIACAACVDACNAVMDSVGKPRGLVRYTSDRHDAEGRFRIARPRLLGYGLVWLLAVAGFGLLVLTRNPVALDVVRDRKQLYREHVDGSVENVYAVKLSNKSGEPQHYRLSAEMATGASVQLDPAEIDVAAGAHESVTVTARIAEPPPGVSKIRFQVLESGAAGHADDHVATFLAPAGG